MNHLSLWISSLVFMLTSCATTSTSMPKKVSLARDVQLTLPSPKLVSPACQAEQLLTLNRQGENHQLHVVFKNDHKKLSVTGLSMIGTVFEVAYEESEKLNGGQELSVEALDPRMDKEFLLHALADLIFIMAPLKDLEGWITKPSTLTESKGVETEMVRSLQESGKILLEAEYKTQSPCNIVADFKNHVLDYSINIKTLNFRFL